MSFISSHWQIVRHALDEEKRTIHNLVTTKETAFLPAALEITQRPVSPTARATTWVLLGGLLLTALWLTFGKIDVVASAPGKLIPVDNVKLVQPAEPGIVRAILVRDGQQVKRGQVLIELDPTVSGAEAEQARKALQTAELDAARARAILSALDGKGLAFVAPPGTPDDVAQTQGQLARAQLAEIEAMVAGNNADSRVAIATRGEAQVQAAKLAETLPLLDQQIAANEALLEKGYVSKLRVIEMKRQRLIAGRDRDAALETIKRTSAQIASAGSGGVRSKAEARVRILGDLAKATSEATLRREELVKSTQRSSLQRLTAPVDGTIAQLAVHTVGGVVEAAKPIMVVVPSGDSLIVEAKVLNKDMAFPFTRYGTVPGTIESIGSDAVEDEKLGLIYTVRVKLARTTMARGDRMVQLSPGMAATADIKTGRRSILSYLVSPIDEARLSAGRER
jgi:hemolysin D